MCVNVKHLLRFLLLLVFTAHQLQLVLGHKHQEGISTCLLCAPNHRGSINHWKTNKGKVCT